MEEKSLKYDNLINQTVTEIKFEVTNRWRLKPHKEKRFKMEIGVTNRWRLKRQEKK
jgi:hypothetical protein